MVQDASRPAGPSAVLEPGLLRFFRMIMGVVLTLQTGTVALTVVGVGIGEIKAATTIFPVDVIVEWCSVLGLLVYLYSTKIQRYCGRYYLPLAIALYSIGTILQHYYVVFQAMLNPVLLRTLVAQGEAFDLASSGWSLLVALLVPLVMVAWQYHFRAVLLYISTVALVELPFLLYLTLYVPEIAQVSDPPPLAFALVARTVIFSAVGYSITRMIGAQREQRQALTVANEKLRAHAATLEQLTISQERNRLARELHDTLAHSLSAVSVQLEAVDSVLDVSPQDARHLLNKALAQTRSGLAETRRAMQSLRASPLDDLGLKLALRTLAETTAQRGGLQLDLQLADIEELPPATEQNIYRIAQEALTNVLKHAGARQIAVTLTQAAGKTRLMVCDDGIGFDPAVAQRHGHFGLEGLQERTTLIGATMAVSSQPGRGTTVEVVI